MDLRQRLIERLNLPSDASDDLIMQTVAPREKGWYPNGVIRLREFRPEHPSASMTYEVVNYSSGRAGTRLSLDVKIEFCLKGGDGGADLWTTTFMGERIDAPSLDKLLDTVRRWSGRLADAIDFAINEPALNIPLRMGKS